jgi:ABC-type polysaccharide/polyol phosphate transport system ATPase subunit
MVAVSFDNVSKKFARGLPPDSLRDLIPSLAKRSLRRRSDDALTDNEFWALRDVSFEVEQGKALGIIGPNGAGKSTVLKLLTRILKPTLGRCLVRGRTGALIEIAAGFHPDLTGRENVFLQGAIMGMKPKETQQRFSEIVDFSGISAFIDTPVKRYSSGMGARLGFAIAAHLNPQVLIIDEVLGVGDMAFQRKCIDRMSDFKRQGVAIVFVSHNLEAVSSREFSHTETPSRCCGSTSRPRPRARRQPPSTRLRFATSHSPNVLGRQSQTWRLERRSSSRRRVSSIVTWRQRTSAFWFTGRPTTSSSTAVIFTRQISASTGSRLVRRYGSSSRSART